MPFGTSYSPGKTDVVEHPTPCLRQREHSADGCVPTPLCLHTLACLSSVTCVGITATGAASQPANKGSFSTIAIP